MNTLSLPTDELFQVEHRIAQRADELARASNREGGYARTHWERAEAEIWTRRFLNRRASRVYVAGLPLREPFPVTRVARCAVGSQATEMLFRIVADHTHRAVVDGVSYVCLRSARETEAGVEILWAAYRGDTLLKSDCRTLNEAKALCRKTMTSGAP